jgi:cytochrome bd-type quinol oxidase subunit 2
VGWIDTELVLVSIAAMLSPTTLTFSILTLVLSERPLRTGLWFYLGAMAAMLGIGILAAFFIGDLAASDHPSTPKTWVAILDVVLAVFLLAWMVRQLRRPRDPARQEKTMQQIRKVTESPAVAIVGAGATLANAGAFIPIALKDISELNPSTAEYFVDWLFYSIVALLPLAVALLLLVVARDWAKRQLDSAGNWLQLHVMTIAAVLIVLIAASLLRNGIAGLTA